MICKYARSSRVKEAYNFTLKFTSNSTLRMIFEKKNVELVSLQVVEGIY